MKTLITSTLKILHTRRRALLTFHLFFSGLAMAAITPAITWALASLRPVTGRAAISTGGMIEYLTSPGGVVWVLVTLNLTVLVIMLQQAGMTLIAASPPYRHYQTAMGALWGTARRCVALIQLTVIQVFTHLLIALPFLAATGLAWAWLTSSYDPYLLREELPLELWWFAVCATVSMLGLITCNGALYLRWILVVPCLMLRSQRPVEALRESTRLTRGHKGHATGVLASGLTAVILLPILVTLAFDQIASLLLTILPDRTGILVPAIFLFIAGYILIGIAVTFFGTAAYGAFIVSLYYRATGRSPRMPEPSLSYTPPGNAGPKAWIAEALVVILALGQAWFVVDSLDQREQVTITAHRGSAFKAPENTLSAIEQAIRDGADYIEVDVQITADGVPVLWHDSDMSRIFGQRERISEVAFEDIRNRDAGSWFNTDFAGERIATLSQAVETVRGRAGLFVDLKPDRNTPNLTRAVVELLQSMNFVDGTVIAAADWTTLREVERLEPGLKTALLAQFVVGPLWEDNYDILGLRSNRATPAAVARAHRDDNELHVWTVNRRAAMSKFVDMGVDNIITDRPDVLSELLQERASLSNAELLATKLRNWLR
ncbi:glycerophosphoryl diester phosphodiesterase [Marinobacter lipolyticus SM19]|uniref:Glycerophosphoryl diester phosphodiesterase n=1 Tax=Marinobacter lipolyticus SM19 TaxID=1318628 RepID=R8B695_9GAMM|nr:glycerophosphodiester phosphodiesterase family protein [Marinobacter lipolyticus]EON94112.1 glycerophosphoryl diester phosphodiesterase [Marinobacter lipolyticus SM19]